MKLTNVSNLPDAIVKAVKNDNYSKGDADFSITELLKPPRQRILQIQCNEFIEEDVSERIWALLGQVTHGILERAETKAETEQRYYATIDSSVGPVTIGGQIDNLHVESETLYDYKLCSVWEYINGLKKEREEQINSYRWLLEQNEIEINSIKIVAIFRDWSKTKASREQNYPQTQVAIIPVKVWELLKAHHFIKERLQMHLEAENAETQDDLPECTAEERWLRDETWAVMKKGRKSAIKLHDNKDHAIKHLEACNNQHYIEHRPGIPMRCEFYCNVAKFCRQYINGGNHESNR